jgi:hypothetical protein
MRMRIEWAALAVLALLANRAGAANVTFQVIYDFTIPGSLTGTPTYIVEVSPGMFMGTAANGPEVFSITSDGTYNNIYVFPTIPSGFDVFGLAPALNNQVYGGGNASGTAPTVTELYSISRSGAITTYPYNPVTQGGPFNLVQHPDNHIYGFFATVVGAPAVFTRLDYLGNPTPLHTLSPDQGAPNLMFLGSNDDFFGLSTLDGARSAGIFRMTTAGSFSWVTQSFAVSGYSLALIQASNGKFYGTLPQAGRAGAGSIYEASLNGHMRTIYEFPRRTTGMPTSLIEASDGMLYGTTIGEDTHLLNNAVSTIFRLDPSSGNFQTLYSFAGRDCECSLVQGSDGRIYGISSSQQLAGTFFVLDAGLAPPKPYVSYFAPAAGSAGQLVLLWGRNLLGATEVSFKGVRATTFDVPTTQGIWVEVPSGASTGPITVTTPNGSFVTSQTFTVE